TRNLITVLAGILIVSPVAGLRPSRAFRCCLTSLPIPGIVNSPAFFASLYAMSAKDSMNRLAVFLFVPVLSASSAASCVFDIFFPAFAIVLLVSLSVVASVQSAQGGFKSNRQRF